MNRLFLIIATIFYPTTALALVPHSYPGIYTNIIGRIFFLISCMVLIVYLIRNNLHRAKGWKYIYYSVIFFNIWNLDMMLARSSELWVVGELEGLKYLEQHVFLSDWRDYILYLANFDYAILNTAMLLFYIGLRQHLSENNTPLASATMMPYLPIIVFDILGSAVFLALSIMCLHTSYRLLKKDTENIIWNYMVWLTASYTLYAFSRTMGYILRHLFLAIESIDIMRYIEPISGSVNTLTFIWLGTVSLFFIRMYPIYLKMSEDKRKIEEINVDIINLNNDLEVLVAERTMAILGLSVADKVRNPVAIIGCICKRMLHKEKLSETATDNLKDVIAECKKLETIVGDFENILRTRQRMFKYIDLNEVAHDIILLMKKDTLAKDVTIIENFSEGNVNINAQKNLLRAGLFHIIKNALDATPPGGVIEVSTRAEANNVVVTVKDTGPGIPNELIQKIFDPFFSTRENRMGMGLPLVKQIVSEHLGDIKVHSEEGKGTSFELIFPSKWCVLAEDVRREVTNGIKR